MGISVSPLMVFEFSKKDALTVQFKFASRRSYTTKIPENTPGAVLSMKQSGREWYFNRVALSYKHSF